MNQLSIVILNYNGKKHLEQFLPSVLAHADGHEVIVADNHSTDDSVAFLKEKYPQVRLIINPTNGGFAKGYNDALKQINSELYLLLNSDIEVGPGWIQPLIDGLSEGYSACQPKVKAFHNPTNFEHAGAAGGFIDKDYFPFCRGRIMDYCENDKGQYNDPMEVFWASGAALLIKADVFHQMGGFDEDFFAHMEEIDLCWRMKRHGHRIGVVPQSEVFHVGGGTLSYNSPFKTYLNFRNSLYMLIKNHDGLLFPKWLRRMTLDGIAGLRFLMRGEWQQLNSVWKAHRDMYKNLNKFRAKRKILKSTAKDWNPTGMYNGSILVEKFLKKKATFGELSEKKFR